MANPATKLNSKSPPGCLTDILFVKTASEIIVITTTERIDFFELFFMKNKLYSALTVCQMIQSNSGILLIRYRLINFASSKS